jgi:hypothetical protein
MAQRPEIPDYLWPLLERVLAGDPRLRALDRRLRRHEQGLASGPRARRAFLAYEACAAERQARALALAFRAGANLARWLNRP